MFFDTFSRKQLIHTVHLYFWNADLESCLTPCHDLHANFMELTELKYKGPLYSTFPDFLVRM